MSYLGIDIGMTGAKALIVGENGRVLKRKYTDYGSEYKKNLQKEINPHHIWNGVRKIIQSCQCNRLKDQVKTIAGSVSGDDFFPAGRGGKPLSNVISAYQDTGIEYEDYINERAGGPRNIFRITGQPIQGNIYPLHRILWIKNNLPRIYEKTWKFLCWEDYINYLLTGRCTSDYSLVSRTLLFDINKKEWSRSLVEGMQLDYEKFSEVDAPGRIIGKVQRKIAEELGLPSNCLVVTGGFDQPTACLGAGVTQQSVFSLSLGTVAASHWLTEENFSQKKKGYSYCCSLVEGKHMGLFFTSNGCAVLNWFLKELAGGKDKIATGKNVYERFNSQISSGRPSKLFLMPHLGGATQPYNNPHSKGVLLGLKFDTNSADIAKAIYEGIAFDLKRNYRLLEKNNMDIKEIRVVGGGSRSNVWMQLLANVTGYAITTLENEEGGSMAVALMGACAVKHFGGIEEAVGAWIKKKATFHPEANALADFEEKYEKYIEIYDNVKPFNHFLEAYNG